MVTWSLWLHGRYGYMVTIFTEVRLLLSNGVLQYDGCHLTLGEFFIYSRHVF